MGGRVVRVASAWLAVLGAALGVSMVLAGPAAAHNSLTGSDPANGARLARVPARIELTFLARPDPTTTRITVTGPDDVPAAGGAPSFSGARVSVPFRAGAAGLYIVGYQVVSSDGHPLTGEVRFTLTVGTPAQPPSSGAAPGAAGPSAAEPSAAGSPSAVPQSTAGAAGPAARVPAADATADGGRPAWLWVLAALALVMAFAVIFVRRRPTRR